MLRTDDPRWWIAVGLFFGLALLDHWTIALFAGGLFLGLLCTPQRALLWSPWAVGGALVALVIALPNILWQAQHNWPQLTFARHIRDYGSTAKTVPSQFLLLGAASFLLALPGLLWLLRSSEARVYRSLGVAFLFTLALVLVSGGKEYYTAASFPLLLAAGGVRFMHTSGWPLPLALVGIGLVFFPFATPLLPASTANFVRGLNPEIGEMIGWSHVVDVVAPVAAAHPDAPILTSNYSEAGVIELLGKPKGMPQPYSGALNYWYWGHPDGVSETTIVVGFDREYLARFFSECTPAETIRTPGGVRNQEDGTTVWLCNGQRADWASMWPALRHY
jgi:hypothetical protein